MNLCDSVINVYYPTASPESMEGLYPISTGITPTTLVFS
jgi:hypothetical protein